MLGPYQVIDLTDSRAELGPMMLADLGADVVKVEPPGGCDSRRATPLDPSLPDGLASLRFHAYNRNKRAVTLDLDTEEGREGFHRLVAGADFLFENAPPGAMAARGLGFDDLRAVNPRLVYVAITPFGQDGPYAGYLATDLTLSAMSGQMAVNGDSDRAPVRVSVPQAWLHAAAESASAALLAHHRRLQINDAQFVDVSVQASLVLTALNAAVASAVQGKDIERNGTALQLGTATFRVLFRAADGDVVLVVNGRVLDTVVRWMADEGIVPAAWASDEDWPTYDRRLLSQQPLTHGWDEVMDRLDTFIAVHTKDDLLARGMAAGVFIAPENTVADVLAFPHLEARGYWQPLTLPNGREIRAPGPFVRLSRTPITYRRDAPTLGADDAVARA